MEQKAVFRLWITTQERLVKRGLIALRSDVSARHLGFVETSRASPGRALVFRLAHELDVPLREGNVLLVAAGLVPMFGETSIELTLEAHKPFPAFAINRH